MADHADTRFEGVSEKTDALASDLLGHAFDLLAAGDPFEVLAVTEDVSGNTTTFELCDDSREECLVAARERVREQAHAARYAIAYEGAIQDEDGSYIDALLLEFGERGWKSYSAFSVIAGKGTGENFSWTDPAPAGEMEPLL